MTDGTPRPEAQPLKRYWATDGEQVLTEAEDGPLVLYVDAEAALATAHTRLVQLDAERERLTTALREYGQHYRECDFRYRPIGNVLDESLYPCTCGFAKVLESLR